MHDLPSRFSEVVNICEQKVIKVSENKYINLGHCVVEIQYNVNGYFERSSGQIWDGGG